MGGDPRVCLWENRLHCTRKSFYSSMSNCASRLSNAPARTILYTRASRSTSHSLPVSSGVVPTTEQMNNWKKNAPQLTVSDCVGVRASSSTH